MYSWWYESHRGHSSFTSNFLTSMPPETWNRQTQGFSECMECLECQKLQTQKFKLPQQIFAGPFTTAFRGPFTMHQFFWQKTCHKVIQLRTKVTKIWVTECWAKHTHVLTWAFGQYYESIKHRLTDQQRLVSKYEVCSMYGVHIKLRTDSSRC